MPTVTTSSTLASKIPAISPAEASRFLTQAGLFVSDSDIQYVVKNGKEAWINQQVTLTSSTSRVNWLLSQGYANDINKNNAAGIDNVIWHHLIAENNHFVQRITLFWTEFFVVSMLGLPISWAQFLGASYLDTLEKNAFGNFRDLLKAVTLSPAMGEYLNLSGSLKASGNRHPDENYAREVMQLFTIGLELLYLDGTSVLSGGKPIPTYGQNDITGLAAAFTGWNFDGLTANYNYATVPMKMTESNHQSTTPNTFLGKTIPAGTTGVQSLEIILDTLFKHPNVGPFIAQRLILRLVTSNPSPQYVARVAGTFNNNGKGVRGDMLAVIKAVLLDSEASSLTVTGRIREPMLRFVQWAKTFNATSSTNVWGIGDTSNSSYLLGQSPLRAPSVFNYYDPTFTLAKVFYQLKPVVAPEMQIIDEVSSVGYINFMQGVISNGIADVKPNYAVEIDLAKKDAKALPKDANLLITHLNLVLASNQLSSTTITSITSAINAMSSKDDTAILNRVKAAIFLIMVSPDYLVIR
jgi:uncharacterized protein (DUF1800 family)